jgi:hypothetical protein
LLLPAQIELQDVWSAKMRFTKYTPIPSTGREPASPKLVVLPGGIDRKEFANAGASEAIAQVQNLARTAGHRIESQERVTEKRRLPQN